MNTLYLLIPPSYAKGIAEVQLKVLLKVVLKEQLKVASSFLMYVNPKKLLGSLSPSHFLGRRGKPTVQKHLNHAYS